MIFHSSFSAKDPERVARVIAELWKGEALPFLSLGNGSWLAVAPDERCSAMEVYPYDTVLVDDETNNVAQGYKAPDFISSHFAIGTELNEDEIFAIGEREGWSTRKMHRKGGFDVIELWCENRVMLEVLTDEMQADYVRVATIDSWMKSLEKWKAAGLGEPTAAQ